jgi:two-component system sensor histidine kinase KdpD
VSGLAVRHLEPTNLAMIFLLAVVVSASALGRGPSILTVVLGVAAFDFFFVPPHLTFAVDDAQYLLTFGVMLVVGLTISTLTVRLRDQAETFREGERRARALFELSRALADAEFEEAILHVAIRETRSYFGAAVAVLRPDAVGELSRRAGDAEAAQLDELETTAAEWAYVNRRAAGATTRDYGQARGLYLPLPGPLGDIYGVLALRWANQLPELHDEHLYLLETFANQIALALGRVQRPDAAR